MTRKKFLIIGILTLSALIAGGVGYVRTIDVDRYRSALADELRVATGREVAIDGPIGLSLLPWPRFSVSGIAIANAPWGTRRALARIERVDADIALLPLLRGEYRIGRVRLVRPDLWFETDSVGKVNWILAAAAPMRAGKQTETNGPLLAALDVGRFDITGGRITYRDGATGDITALSVTSASVEGDGHSSPLGLTFFGEWNALPVALRGSVGPVNAVVSEGVAASAVDLRLEAGGARVSVIGTVADATAGPGAVLRVSAQAEQFDRLGRRFGIALPLAERVSLDADIRYRQQRLEVSGVNLRIGKQAVTGTASVDLSNPRPVFEAAIHAAEIDISGLAPAPAGASPAMSVGELGPLDALISSGLLVAGDGSLKISAAVLRMGGTTLRDVDAHLALTNGGLIAKPVKARSVAGDMDGSFSLDTASSPPRMTLSVRAPAFVAGPLLQRFGTIKAFGGVASVAANLTAAVGTPDVMLSSLDGEALLAMGEGRITLEPYETPFENNLSGVGGLVGLLAADGHLDVAIECVAGRITMAGGVAKSDGFVLLSRDARVKGDGTLDFATGSLALRFVPEARNGKLLIDQAVLLSGSLREPVLKLDGAPRRGFGLSDTALYPLRRFFSGIATNPAANACLRALPPAPRKRRLRGRPIAQNPVPIAPKFAPSPVAPEPPVGGTFQAE